MIFGISGAEGRQAFSRPPAFANALAEAKGGGQRIGRFSLGMRDKLAVLAHMGGYCWRAMRAMCESKVWQNCGFLTKFRKA